MFEEPTKEKQETESLAKKEVLPQKSRATEKSSGIFDSLKKSKLIRPLVLALALAAGGGPLVGKARDRFFEIKDQSARIEHLNKSIAIHDKNIERIRRESDILVQKIRQAQEIFGHRAAFGFNSEEEIKEKMAVGYFKLRYDNEPVQISGEHLYEAVKIGFPQQWVEKEIKTIKQVEEVKRVGSHYGLKGNWKTVATTTRKLFLREDITFYKDSETNLEEFLHTLSHEIGHANDWESDNEMDATERVDLLLAIRERLQSKDRYVSDYVESIENKDKQEELYLKAVEYWAEICAAYFSDPENLNYKDFVLVNNTIKKHEPDYDSSKWQEAKAKLYTEMQNQSRISQIKKSMDDDYERY